MIKIAIAAVLAATLSACAPSSSVFSTGQSESPERPEAEGAETLSPNESTRPEAEGIDTSPAAAPLIKACE